MITLRSTDGKTPFSRTANIPLENGVIECENKELIAVTIRPKEMKVREIMYDENIMIVMSFFGFLVTIVEIFDESFKIYNGKHKQRLSAIITNMYNRIWDYRHYDTDECLRYLHKICNYMIALDFLKETGEQSQLKQVIQTLSTVFQETRESGFFFGVDDLKTSPVRIKTMDVWKRVINITRKLQSHLQ